MIWQGEIQAPCCFDGSAIRVVAKQMLGQLIRYSEISLICVYNIYIIYIYIHFDLNTSLSATVTACWCSTWLQKHPTGPRSYSSFRFQVLGAEQPLPVSTCSYFEVKVLHNPDTRGGLALGVCGHLPSGTETHSIRPLLWWEEEKGKNWRVVLVFVFAGGRFADS